MMPEMQDFHKFMENFVKMLVQQGFEEDRVRRWLQKSLREYQELGKLQTKQAQESRMTSLLNRLFGVTAEGVKGKDYPEADFLESLRGMGIPGMEIPAVPSDYADKKQAIGDIVRQFAISREAGEFPAESIIEDGTQFFGSKAMLDLLDKYFKGEMRKDEITGAEDLRKIEWEKVKIRKKGEKTNKELKEDLEDLEDERDDCVEKLTKAGGPIEEEDVKMQQFYIAKIDKINGEIKKLEGKLGEKLLPTEEDKKKFEERARANTAAGRPIDWSFALLEGFPADWLIKLMKELEKEI